MFTSIESGTGPRSVQDLRVFQGENSKVCEGARLAFDNPERAEINFSTSSVNEHGMMLFQPDILSASLGLFKVRSDTPEPS